MQFVTQYEQNKGRTIFVEGLPENEAKTIAATCLIELQ